MIDLTTDPVTNLRHRPQPPPGTGNNQPTPGGGEPIVNGTLPVSLSVGPVGIGTTTGKIALHRAAEPSPPGTFNPMNCNDCSVHGVTVRRRGATERTSAGTRERRIADALFSAGCANVALRTSDRHSERSADIGLIRMARRVGTNAPAAAMVSMSSGAPMKATGS